MQQGMQQGIQQGERTLVLRQLERKFGAKVNNYSDQLDAMDAEQLLDLGDRLLDAKSLDELFKPQ